MQEDMHYYGTYAMARAAGIPTDSARVIAYAAQYVDDSTATDSGVHDDGGMFHTIATAHTNAQAIGNAIADQAEQRMVWVPFHFFPGGEGDDLSERLLCVKESELAREMVANHIRHAVSVKDTYGLTLMGVMAHVYADTFSHYGFSGVSSSQNKVDGESFELDVEDPKVKAYIMSKFTGFLAKYTPRFLIKNYRRIASRGASSVTGALGHGAVGTYPDRPFLRWRFTYKKGRRDSGWRDNRQTFLEGCEKLHAAFQAYAEQAGISAKPVAFADIRDKVAEILAFEGAKEERTEQWRAAITSGELFEASPSEEAALHYAPYHWEQMKEDFDDLDKSRDIIGTRVYQFHQAAIYHRDYTLKQLLPRHGILVV